MLKAKNLFIQLTSTTSEQIAFVVQNGIVAGQKDGKFTTENLAEEFKSEEGYQFMKFFGNTDGFDTEITTDTDESITVMCYTYDGSTQNIITIPQNLSVGDNNFRITASDMNNLPGYCFFRIESQNITVYHEQQFQELQLNEKEETLHNYAFSESNAYSTVLVDISQFQSDTFHLSIVVTSDSPSIYKFSTLYISKTQFYSRKYDDQGNLIDSDNDYLISYTGGITLQNNQTNQFSNKDEYQYCTDETHCYLYISSSFDTVNFYLTNIQSYYQPLHVNAFVLENAQYIEQKTISQHIQSFTDGNTDIYIINSGLIYSNLIQNSVDQGYTFSLIGYSQIKSKAIINVNSISKQSGVYLSSLDNTEKVKQIIISQDINRQYYVLQQMYFLMLENQQQELNYLVSVLNYQINEQKSYQINNLQGNSDVSVHASTQNYKQNYQVCLTWKDGSDNVSLYVSNTYQVPSAIDNAYDQYNNTIITLQSQAKQLCCVNDVGDSDWMYARIQNDGNESLSGELTFGEYLHQYASLKINTPTYLTFSENYPYIKTVNDNFSNKTITTSNYYFQAKFDEQLQNQATIYFIDIETNVTWYQIQVEQNQSQCNCIFEAPTNKQLIIQLYSENQNNYYGEYYIGQITNDIESLNIIKVQDQSLPAALLKFQPYDYQYPIISISQDQGYVNRLVAYVCEKEPQLQNTQINQDCIKIQFIEKQFDYLILPLDINYTSTLSSSKYKNMNIQSVPYYVTIFYNEPLDTIQYYSVETYYAQALTSNQMNGIKLIPSTTAQFYGANWFSLDQIVENTPLKNVLSYIDFNQEIDTICVTLDNPMSYLEFQTNRQRCIQISDAISSLSVEIPYSMGYYRRVYYNILISNQVLSQVQQIYCSCFKYLQKSVQNTAVTIKPAVTRAGEDVLQYFVNVQNTKQILVTNQLATNINTYEQMIQNGTSKYTRLLISDYQNPTLENSLVDDTIAIQVVQKQLKWQEYQYIQIQASVELAEEVDLRISVYSDDNITMEQLSFLQQKQMNNIPAKQLTSLYFKASHTPAYITYEICSAKKDGIFSSYSSPVVVEPSLKTICDNQTTILDDKFSGYVVQYLPIDISSSDKFTNINYFFSTQFNQSDITYQVLTTDGILRPVLPDQQEVYVQKISGDKYQLLFRPASLPQQNSNYDNVINYNVNQYSEPDIQYSVYVIDKNSITDTSIINTVCGLQMLTQTRIQFNIDSQSKEQQKQEIILQDVNEDSLVILVAENNANHLSIVYDPVSIQFSTTTINQTALICGIVFGIIGVIIIGIAIYFIVKYSKAMQQKKLYGNYE